MGVPEFKYKMIAFATSSFFAGISGALFASFAGKLPASQFNLALSVEFIAILLIGGVGTVSGTILGTFFVVLSPKFVESFTEWAADKTDGERRRRQGRRCRSSRPSRATRARSRRRPRHPAIH